MLTGGSGRLGRALRELLPGVLAPDRRELDVTDYDQVRRYLDAAQPDVVVHAAAFTDVAAAQKRKEECWRVNVVGTRNVVRALGGARLVHISTDYVFYGDSGGYREDDPVGPVRNYYALSKLVAEELVRLADLHLVIRTSFRPNAWPYEVAFDDLFTSQDYLDVIAPEVALAIRHVQNIPFDTVHIGTECKSVFDLARRRRPDVRRASKAEAGVSLPDDISLNTERWRALRARFGR